MAIDKKPPEINASSMADIAFLLLIFFLVTTTIDVDKGILHKLPPWVEDEIEIPPINKRNVLEININQADYLLVEGNYMNLKDLKDFTVKFLTNNGRDPNLSDDPTKAVVSLKNDRGTSYGVYLRVQDELKAAYAEIRDAEAYKLTNGTMTYDEIEQCYNNKELTEGERDYCKGLRDEIRDKYPMKISEAEPENLGG